MDEQNKIENAIIETLLQELKRVDYKEVSNCLKCPKDCITQDTRIKQLHLTMAFNNVNCARNIMIESGDDDTRPTVSDNGNKTDLLQL